MIVITKAIRVIPLLCLKLILNMFFIPPFTFYLYKTLKTIKKDSNKEPKNFKF